MDLDRNLDDIIKSKKKGRKPTAKKTRTSTGNAKASITGPAPAAATARRNVPAKAPPSATRSTAQPGLEGNKIIVSNLPEDVTEPQIRELFSSTIGPLKSVSLTYDAQGKSKGIATIEFKLASDGGKAFQQYNKRLIDQKRPMKVEIIVDPTKIPPPSLSSRVGAAPPAPSPPIGRRAPQPKAAKAEASKAPVVAATRGGKGPRGKGRGRKGAGARPAVTVADLDQEMTDYQAANVAPA